MDLYTLYVPQAAQMLKNLKAWLKQAEQHADSLGFDPNVLLSARLYPNQYDLLTQLRIACDTAKLTSARVSGKTAPSHPDTETSLEEIYPRIDSVLEYLGSLTPSDFEGAEGKMIEPAFDKTLEVRADDYIRQFGIPNLYFHLVTAYSILRHNGVPLGKIPFIGHLSAKKKVQI